MKASILPVLLLCSILTSCSTDQSGKNAAVGLVKTRKIAFSDIQKQDLFKVITAGEKAENMRLIFTITSFANQEIYKKEIKVEELLKGYLASADLKKEAEKQKFIKSEVDFFLNEDNFLEPAVTENEKADQYAPDHSFYDELKETQLNGFSYRLGKSTKIYIAWSVKEQRVKVYYKCC